MDLKRILTSIFVTFLCCSLSNAVYGQCISGQTVAVEGGATEVSTCPGDGIIDELDFVTSSLATPFGFLITDEDNVILEVSISNFIDFENAGVGVCRVWAFSFAGQVLAEPGQIATEAELASLCYELTDNFVTVNRTVPEGGMVSAENGATTVFTCPDDGIADVVTFSTTSTAVPYVFIITDADNKILGFADGNSQDFDAAGIGSCRVWGAAYAGDIVAEIGEDVTTATIGSNCFDLSDNFLEVIRGEADGGTVALADGSTAQTICAGDTEADVLTFTNTSNTIGSSYAYVITDDQNIILTIADGDTQDFNGAGPGVCRVWGLAYTGTLLAAPGDNAATTALADGCFDLSDNFIEVTRIEADGATVALDGGATELTVCVGDDVSDVLTFTNTSSSSETYVYLVTDENNVLLTIADGNTQDFDGAGPGVCRVWGLSYSGNITISAGENAATTALSDQCFDLSDNFITITREEVNGGTVALSDGTTAATICADDGVEDVLTFTNQTSASLNYSYIVTDDQNKILAILDGDMLDFDVAGPGICRVWGLSYAGTIIAEVGENAATTQLADGCFDLSDNFIEVTRITVDGGTVALPNGETEANVCAEDGIEDVLTFIQNTTALEEYVFLITDENNIILGIADGNTQDFDGAGPGLCRVWGLSYSGNLTVVDGEDAATQSLSDECFDLSDNFITVTREVVDGGTVALTDGSTSALVCAEDGVEDILTFTNQTTASESYAYVVTDDQNIILALLDGDMLDFDVAGPGVCRVWGLSYTGTILAEAGDDAAATTLTDRCFDLSDNFIEVTRKTTDGGTVALDDGSTEVTVCVGDGEADELVFTNMTTSTEEYVFVITDENNIILGVTDGNTEDFDGVEEGICRIWGLSFSGDLIAVVGESATAQELSDECFDLSDNFITINRIFVDGGTVALADGSTSALVCADDGVEDILTFTNQTTANQSYAFVVTDDENEILAVLDGDMLDFDVAGPGVCRVWGLSYSGSIIAEAGDNAAAVALSDACFDLSDNFIEVTRTTTDGGIVSTAEGLTAITVCVGDDESDEISFTTTSDATENYVFIITDENNTALGIIENGSFDFDGVEPGICRIWGLSYTGTLTLNTGDDVPTTQLSDECFDLSDNFVNLTRIFADGGTVALTTGETSIAICAGDGTPDELSFEAQTGSTLPYAFVVTDDQNIILSILDGNTVDFDVAGPGVCRVWGLSYDGTLLAAVGDDAAAIELSDGCFDLSDNFIEVTRTETDGGEIALSSGETSIDICVGDGTPDELSFTTSSTAGSYAYIITDENNVVLAVADGNTADLEGAGAGICRVWGLSYTGMLTVTEGESATAQDLSDDCFNLSDNFITVNRESVDGGNVVLPNGMTEAIVCVSDNIEDILTFEFISTSTSDYVFVVTDADNIILTILDGDMIDFDVAGFGVCRVWGLSYTGNIIAEAGDDAAAVALSDQCFDLSENFIEVTRIEADGGMVSTTDGETTVFTCPGDGNEDIINFSTTSTAATSYAYVITEEDNSIIEITAADEFDFDQAPVGICRVWGLSYLGEIIAEVGDDAGTTILSDDCFDLSDNFIAVIREVPEGGTVSTTDGETTVYTCPGDDNADLISFASQDASGSNFTYVVTDENNVILSLPDGNSQDFEGAGEGICRVWGLSYSGNLTAALGDDAAAVALSDDCFDLSDNFIEVIRSQTEGGTVSTVAGDTVIYVCAEDGEADEITFASQGASDANFTYVITTDENIILNITEGNMVDFEAAGIGICRVWGLSYTGNIIAEPGDDAAAVALTDDCFDLSDNFIEVNRDITDGGSITDGNGGTSVELCVGDGNPDVVEFVTSGTSNSLYTYLITDENDFLISTIDENSFDFENAIGGNCRIYGLAYTGVVSLFPGDNIFQVEELTTGCFDLTDNFIQLTRLAVNGGTLSTVEGDTIVYTCPADGVPDVVEFFTTGVVAGAEYQYILTDENDEILGFFDGDSFDFNGLGFGTSRVYGASFIGNFIAQEGTNVTTSVLSDGCYELSSNFLTIVRDQPEGATVSADGLSEILVCIGTDEESVTFDNSSTSNAQYAYVVTDTMNVILAVSTSPTIDFGGAGEGVCRVWGLSYTGNLSAMVGDTASIAELATSCFELSSDFVTVIRSTELDGGIISNVLGETIVFTCPADGTSDLVAVQTTSMAATEYAYFITDENNIVIAPDVDGNVIDFDPADPGICRIWGLSYLGDLTLAVGQDATQASLASDCYLLSENFITVIRDNPNGGMVSTTDGDTTVTVEVGDGIPDLVSFQNENASNSIYQYVITDENNIIIGLPSGNNQNFEDAGVGICRVWGLAYTGSIIANIGDDAAAVDLSDDCFDLSDNFIEVIRVEGLNDDDDSELGEEDLITSQNLPAISEVVVAPNPAVDLVQVNYSLENMLNNTSQIQVLSTTGAVLYQETVPAALGENTHEINIGNFAGGLYIIQVQHGEEFQFVKFIKNQF